MCYDFCISISPMPRALPFLEKGAQLPLPETSVRPCRFLLCIDSELVKFISITPAIAGQDLYMTGRGTEREQVVFSLR